MKKIIAGLALGTMTALGFTACGDDSTAAGKGSITFTTWGEDYIESGIPSEVFADGYSVHYSKFLVVLGKMTVAKDDGTPVAQTDSRFVVNHVEPGVKELVTFDGLDAGNYTLVSYEISPPSTTDTVEPIGTVTQDDVDFMVTNGYNVYVEATITDGTATKSFQWGFGIPTLLDECEGEVGGKVTQGAVVTDNGEDVIQLTIHGDHLYYDDLQSAAAEVRGAAIFAADADGDDVITQEELTAVKLIDLPADQYGTGGAGDVNDLGAFVAFLSRTVGHYRGEGECFVKNPD